MLAVNEQGNLVQYNLPPIEAGKAYCFSHRRRGKIIGNLIAKDHFYYHIILLVKLTTTTRSYYPGALFSLRRSLVYDISHE